MPLSSEQSLTSLYRSFQNITKTCFKTLNTALRSSLDPGHILTYAPVDTRFARLVFRILNSGSKIRRGFETASLFCFLFFSSQACAGPLLSSEGHEGGNLAEWKIREDGVIEFKANRDIHSTTWRWFYFEVSNAKPGTMTFEIPDARTSAARSDWRFGRPFISEDDGQTWDRIEDSEYKDGRYRFSLDTNGGDFQLALAPPYSYSRSLELSEKIGNSPHFLQNSELTKTLDGRPIQHLVLRNSGDQKLPIIWVIARQHPAESASSWKMEGLLEWLVSEDPEAGKLLSKVELHLVPMVNPDGVVRGHYRYNAAGLDLNRQWQMADHSKSPTVAAIKELMKKQEQEGREFLVFFDLHSISSQRKNFMYFTEDLLLREEYEKDMSETMEIFQQMNPLFSSNKSELTIPGEGGIAKDWVYNEFMIPTYTFESSYQNIDYGPEPGRYMSVEDYKSLGRDLGRTMAKIHGEIVKD